MSKKVMLAMSGGVDSSCSLLLLKQQGYDIIGATMKLYDNDTACCALKDIEDAKNVAERFGIPHYTFDFRDEFKKNVIERFNREYLNGLTPNPCVDCNRFMKFGVFLDKAAAFGCDYIATGHYARIVFDNGRYLLKKAIGKNGENQKDQSYVLYNLTQDQMAHILFPLGETEKSSVRKIAEENDLTSHNKSESQDICFVPDKNYAGFIQKYTGTTSKKGNVIDKNGNILGQHDGIINYTIGQRKGLGIAFGKPMYVTGKDPEANTVTVGEYDELLDHSLIAGELNWIAFDSLETPVECKAKTRYKQAEQSCTVYPDAKNTVRVVFQHPQRALTRGQRVVFYNNDIVLGGGVIL